MERREASLLNCKISRKHGEACKTVHLSAVPNINVHYNGQPLAISRASYFELDVARLRSLGATSTFDDQMKFPPL